MPSWPWNLTPAYKLPAQRSRSPVWHLGARAPCPLAPHHSHPQRSSDAVNQRILYAVDPDKEPAVRQLIDSALSAGRLEDRDGATARWELLASARGEMRPEEIDHGQRLLHG